MCFGTHPTGVGSTGQGRRHVAAAVGAAAVTVGVGGVGGEGRKVLLTAGSRMAAAVGAAGLPLPTLRVAVGRGNSGFHTEMQTSFM